MLICASQAYLINKHKNIKGKLFELLFQQCLKKNIVPKYAHLKMSTRSPTAHSSQPRIED